jgi:hypothetical protein
MMLRLDALPDPVNAYLAGLIGHISQSSEITMIGDHITTWQAGDRVARNFSEIIHNHSSNQSTSTSITTSQSQDVLQRAYDTLELSPAASEQEVLAAHERLTSQIQKQFLAPSTHELSMKRHAELNAARKFILHARQTSG